MKARHLALMLFAVLLVFPVSSSSAQSAPVCLYALDPSAQSAFSISGSTSISTSCSVAVESSASQAFTMSGTETLYLQNNEQVGVVGGWLLSGQASIVNQSTGQKVQPVTITSPGDPLAFLPAPTQGPIVGTSHTSYDMNNRPPNNTLSPGVYCGGLTIGNTNGVAFTMSPGTYIMAGGGLTLNSMAVVNGPGVTVYNTSSTGWGCSASSSYTPITISGQASVTMSSPSTGALTGVLLFGDRAGCSKKGSCQDQINGGASTTLNGAMYFLSDTLLFSGNNSSTGCMMAVADMINFNGNSSFAINGCSGTIGGVAVSVTPATATLYGGQTQQFSATVTNTSNTAVTWTISPAGTGSINASGLYTAPAMISVQQTVTVKATSQANPAVSASVTVTLLPKTTPTITWAAPAAITYGTALSSTQLDATASVAGTFVYTPAAGTVVAAGSQTLSVIFTPTNTTAYNTATANVALTVNKATPVITWPAPAAITYGTALSATQLDATASVAGTFVYTPTAGTVLAGGTQTLSVTFTPTNTTDYTTATTTVTLTVNDATPVITWPAPAAITYGTALSATQLNATASVAGTFAYTPAAGTVLAAGSQTLSVTFTPTNTTDYTTATFTVTLTVNKATPVITWPAPAAITYGTALTATQLDATASVVGSLVYTPAAGTVLAGGTQTLSVTFTPTNTTDYTTATATVSLTVNDATPVITWPAPVAITYGTALSATQLDATASVAGTFVYTPAAGTVLTTGTQTLSVMFNPTNTTDYTTATSTVTLTVNKATPAITWPPPAAINYGTPLNVTQLDATASVAGTFVYTPPAGTVMAGGTQTLSVSFTPSNTTNYTTATATVALTVNDAPSVITWPAPAPITYGTALSATQLDATANVAGTFVYTPAADTVLAAGTQTLSAAFTPTDTTDYTTATATVTLTVNKATPVITWPAPASIIAGTALSATQLDATSDVAGTFVYTPTAGTVLAAGAQTLSVAFTPTNTTNYNTSTATVSLNVQGATFPTVVATASPAANANGWNNSSVTVTFTCTAGSYPIKTCPSPIMVTTDGPNQVISGTATDTYGNTATASATVNLEQTAPTIVASASPAANSAGWNNTSVTVTFTCTKSIATITSCSSPQTVSAQGVGQAITGTVQDQAGNQSTASVTLNIDETPPTILQFTAPSQLSPGQSGTATLTVNDTVPITSVVFQLDGTAIGTVQTPPYTVNVAAPSAATSGMTLALTALVTDVAGNVSSANKGIQVVSSGVLVGEVLSDVTGLPLANATLQVAGQASQTAISDSQGRYSIPVTSSTVFLSVSQPGNPGGIPAMVTVERQVSVQSGVGTVPVDARLTPIATATSISASGGTVGTGAITVTVPAGGATTSYYLTPLSQQGLPGLLPLGWSPVAAFDLRTDMSTSASLSANFDGLPPATLNLVTYSYNVHAWTMVTPNLTASSGSLTVPLPSTGDYALVVPDAGNANIQIPAAGQPLAGVQMVALPASATSIGSLSPANVAPTGGTSFASLAVQSSTPLPSGTVIQSQVIETYTLTSGKLISEEPRYEDILLYQTPAPSSAAAAATFPVTPSQTFQVSQLTTGDVHLNILSGRESVRGQTGGSDPVSVQSGDATLTIAAGSLAQDTAIAVSPETVDTFLPSTSTLVPISEYNVDFSGAVLNTAAQLSVGLGGVAPGSNVVIAQISRVNGVPYLLVVSTAQVTSSNIVSQTTPGLPGITQGGDYIFYEITTPTGLVSGTVSASSGPVAAMVQTDGLPFVAFSNSNGSYTIPAAAGTVHLTASIPSTALAGTATAQVTAGQTATQNLTVTGQVESATVTPANGAVGVPLTAEIDVTAADAFNPATVTSSSVVLTAAGSNAPVALQFVFSLGNTKLAVFPQAALQPSTQYTFQAAGLATALGGLISVPTISFTTASITAPTYNTNALVFAMPDQNGNVAISAPANSFPPGSTILIVDQTNGVVYSLTVFNDGSVSGEMPATINDVLQITLTDPAGNKTTFTVSQFVAADGTTAIGPGGGTVAGPNGTGLIVPQGATDHGVTFKLSTFDQSYFPDSPDVDNLQFGSGLQVQVNGAPQAYNNEIKLVFPVPAGAASGAEYYVYRRIVFADGTVGYEAIDEAKVQGSGSSQSVVTASWPFSGYITEAYNAAQNALQNVINGTDYFVLTYIVNPLQNTYSQGAITGRITGYTYTGTTLVGGGIPAVRVYSNKPGVVSQSNRASVFAFTQPLGTKDAGRYTLWDPNYKGGNITVYADSIPGNYLPANPPQGQCPPPATTGTCFQTTAFEVVSTDSIWTLIQNSLLGQYRNVAVGDIAIPAPPAPAPPPAFQISVMQVNNGVRTSTSGIVTTGSSLIIAVNAQAGSSVGVGVGTNIAVNGQTQTVNTSDPLGQFAAFAQYTPALAGVYTAVVTVPNPFGGAPFTVSNTFRAIAPGGGGNTTTVGVAPAILTDESYPTDGRTDVSVNVNPVITFSEPVTIPANSVKLTDNFGTKVPTRISGVDSTGKPYTDITQAPANTAFTSITIQPLATLRYSAQTPDPDPNGTYKIALSSAIQDLNQPPLSLAATTITFYTYKIPVLSPGTENFASPGIFVAQNRAYVAEIDPIYRATVVQYNVSDPTKPGSPKPSIGGVIQGRANDIEGEDLNSVADDKTLIAVSEAPYPVSDDGNFQNSNVYIYKGTSASTPGDSDSLTWIAAASLTQGPLDGVISSITVKGTQLYAATWRKGIQVVDLSQAKTDFQQAGVFAPIYYQLNTAGQGFAQDAVLSTIPVVGQPTMEYCSELNNIKAADYTMAGGSISRLAVATGMVPSASDCLTPASSFVVADVNAVSVVSKSQLQSPTGDILIRGQALALGQIQTASASLNIAAVVGTSASKALLFVVDMTDPTNPKTKSSVPLSNTPTDVLLKGNTAIVGYANDTSEMFDLSNPASPQSLGLIQNVGGKLFLYNGSLLFSSGTVAGAPASPLGGIHSAALGIVGVVSAIPPILSFDQDLSNPNGSRKTLVPVTIPVAVYPPSTPVQNAIVTFSGINAAQQNVTFTNGSAIVQLPAGLLVPSQTFTATLTFTSGGANYVANQIFPTGTVKLSIDLNNDTKIDSTDDTTKYADITSSSPIQFAFWQSANSSGTMAEGDLVDLAALDMHITAGVPAGRPGKIFLAMMDPQAPPTNNQLPNNGATQFFLSDKIVSDLTYLSDPNTVQTQLGTIKKGCSISANTASPNLVGGGCPSSTVTSASGGVTTGVAMPALSGTSVQHYLFQCTMCQQSTGRMLQVLYQDTPSSTPVILDQAPINIQPIQNWIAIYDARTNDYPVNPVDWRPDSYPSASNPVNDFHSQLKFDWADVPDDATNITVLVHGYATSAADAEDPASGFIPVMTKRLYWVGQPVLDTKQNDNQNHAQVVGIEWPGDEGVVSYMPLITSISTFSFFFPEDEEHALESGAPISKFLVALEAAGKGSRTVNLIAHSLGNVAVNSAISLAPAYTVNKYIMYDAALPAEAFGPGFSSDPNLLLHAQALGYPSSTSATDARWIQDWNAMYPQAQNNQAETDLNNWCSLISAGWPNSATLIPPQYQLRWGQSRPAGIFPLEIQPVGDFAEPCGLPSDTPTRGPWLGFFAGNLDRTNIVNAYNQNDLILAYPWKIMQIEQKPNNSSKKIQLASAAALLGSNTFAWTPSILYPVTQADDSRSAPFWAQLQFTSSAEASVFGGVSSSNIIRQWAELSQWFPSLTPAVGNVPAAEAVGIPDILLDNYSPPLPALVTTHTYLYGVPFSGVWGGYVALQQNLAGSQ